MSIADLARHAEYRDVKISPDGAYLAATAVVRGQTVLALIHLGAGDKKGNLLTPRAGDDVTDFWWVSPTRVVYAVGLHQGGYDAPLATGELFAVNADGGECGHALWLPQGRDEHRLADAKGRRRAWHRTIHRFHPG